VTIEAIDPDNIEETYRKIFFTYDAKKGNVTFENKLTGPLNTWLKTPYGILRAIPNAKYLTPASSPKYYFNLLDSKNVANDILHNLKVSATNKLSSVVELRYKEIDPKLAEDILNELIIAYNTAAVSEKNEMAKNTLSFLEQRLKSVSDNLQSIEQKIQKYKAVSGAVDIGTQGRLYLQNVSDNDQKLSQVNMQLSVINQLEKQVLENDLDKGILPSNLGITDPTLTELTNSLNRTELEREKLKKTVAGNNPLLVSLNDQADKIKSNIISNIHSQRKTMEASKIDLAATNNTYNDLLFSIPTKERELLEISRDQNIKSGIYSFLLQKREESELSYVSTLSNSRVVNMAQASNDPVSPNRMIVFGIAFLASLGLPIAFIQGKESFGSSVLYRQEIEKLTSVPIIGEIAYNKSGEKLAIEPRVRSMVSETFRKIRFSLLSLGINATRNKILVTSSISGEGKSFISANLALSYSLTGKKVVLVDFDLHNSTLCNALDIEEKSGISDFLSSGISIQEIIHPVKEYDNFFFVSSGSQNVDPSSLLENDNLQDLIGFLENEFDVVIIDSSPIVPTSDAHVLSAYCDITLFIVRHNKTPKILLKRLDDNNGISPLTNPVIVFNGITTRGYFNNNYSYGYGYGYKQDVVNNKRKRAYSA
jgi:capsular exopolysaccharide synthesis family protein